MDRRPEQFTRQLKIIYLILHYRVQLSLWHLNTKSKMEITPPVFSPFSIFTVTHWFAAVLENMLLYKSSCIIKFKKSFQAGNQSRYLFAIEQHFSVMEKFTARLYYVFFSLIFMGGKLYLYRTSEEPIHLVKLSIPLNSSSGWFSLYSCFQLAYCYKAQLLRLPPSLVS